MPLSESKKIKNLQLNKLYYTGDLIKGKTKVFPQTITKKFEFLYNINMESILSQNFPFRLLL